MLSKYEMPKWAVEQRGRMNGTVEDICKHGVGHPNAEWLAELRNDEERETWSVHGCDGCCSGCEVSLCSLDKGGCGCMTKTMKVKYADETTLRCGKCGAKKEE